MCWFEDHFAAQERESKKQRAVIVAQNEAWDKMIANVRKANGGLDARIGGTTDHGRVDDRCHAKGLGGLGAQDRDCAPPPERTNHPFSVIEGGRYPCMHWPFEPHVSQNAGGEAVKYEEQHRKMTAVMRGYMQRAHERREVRCAG